MNTCFSIIVIYFSIKERTETTTDADIEVVSAESVRLAAVLTALMEEQNNTSKRKGNDSIKCLCQHL